MGAGLLELLGLNPQPAMSNPPIQPSATPAAADPYAGAVQQALKQYPWLNKLGAPIKLIAGDGPGESESFMPNADENPARGNYTVQLRSQKAKSNPQVWPDLIASESMDWLARQNPQYQTMAKQFRASMTEPQLRNAHQSYERDKKLFPRDKRTFEEHMTKAQLQEYVRGYLFPKAAPGWAGAKGEGQYTPQQMQLLENFRQYLHGGGTQ